MKGQVHRFHDAVALSLGIGSTCYLRAPEAERLARALLGAARSIRREPFVKAPSLTVEFFADARVATLGWSMGSVVRREDGKAAKPLRYDK